MSHTEPNGQKVFDRIRAAGLTWYGAGEIIAWNNYPTEYSPAEAIRAWMASPGHKAIMVSTGYNYVGYGAAESASGKLLLRRRLRQGTRRDRRLGEVPDHQQAAGLRREGSGHDPLDGRRYAPPGPHRRLALLRGPAAPRRWHVALLGNDDRDLPERHLVARLRPRGPRAGSRQGRQLGLLAGHPHQPLIRPR